MKRRIYFYVFIISFLAVPQFLMGQYFGRNKVVYGNFDFKVLETDNFDIYYYPVEETATMDAARMLERWNSRFTKIFGRPVTKEQPVVLYASHGDFQQTNVVSGFISQGTGGVTEGMLNRVTLPFTGDYKENDHVLGHELVHAFQYDMMRNAKGGLARANEAPLWFIEGLAEYLSIGRKDAFTAMWLRDAVLNDDVPTISDVSRNFKYFPYRYGHALWNYIASGWGDEMISPLFKAVLDSGWDKGIKLMLNVSVDSLSNLWQKDVKDYYKIQLEGKTKPAELGKVIRSEEDGTNLAPVVSPDGKYIALITSANLFTLDLFLIDASTGKVITTLASSNTDRHFDALRFINSSGAWSPDSRSFAFVVIEEGSDQVAIANAPSGEFTREIKIPDVREISHIVWSPDGSSLLISATAGGISDLYLYNLNTNSTTKLTDDKYADLQPDWSPDGRTIVFSSDRGAETNFDSLSFSPLRLCTMDAASKKISVLSDVTDSKQINPQYSADGRNIYYVSDPDGYNNVYRYSVEDGTVYKVTDVATGISGLTETSPAISYAKGTHNLICSVFDKGSYKVNLLTEEQLTGNAVKYSDTLYNSVVSLPPATKSDAGIVSAYLSSPVAGLPSDTSKENKVDYTSSLGLLYVGQPYVGASFSSFGTSFGGGVSMYFSDILGNHLLGTALSINGTLKDIGGEVVYMNQSNRFNYGAGISHIPYLTGYVYSSPPDTVDFGGDLYLADVLNLERQRVFVDQVSLMSQYPFSMNRRLEFSVGYTRYSYDIEIETIKAVGATVVADETRTIDAPPGLNLFQASLAYVGDYSFFGFTSPVNGSRFRFEVDPTTGTLNFMSLLLDYRKYFFFNPVTIALRGMHFGRYFGDSDDSRLSPLQLGFQTWVRGYDVNSIDITECSSPNGDCPEVDRLIGSRVGIFNLEVRLPVFGSEQFGLLNFPYLPLELSAFLDGGVAWTKDSDPIFKFAANSTERIPVFSTGLAARVNLLGYMVGEVYYAYPFERPKKGWMFGFNLAPGW